MQVKTDGAQSRECCTDQASNAQVMRATGMLQLKGRCDSQCAPLVAPRVSLTGPVPTSHLAQASRRYASTPQAVAHPTSRYIPGNSPSVPRHLARTERLRWQPDRPRWHHLLRLSPVSPC
eukprot:4053835-Prymnesium_polylepis.1